MVSERVGVKHGAGKGDRDIFDSEDHKFGRLGNLRKGLKGRKTRLRRFYNRSGDENQRGRRRRTGIQGSWSGKNHFNSPKTDSNATAARRVDHPVAFRHVAVPFSL
jgi:hypothetical protein